MSRIIYKDKDGNMCVVSHLDKSLTTQQIIEKDILPYCLSGEYYEIDFNVLPKDRYFRNAWDHDSKGQVNIHRGKAEGIHMDNLRMKRNTKLDKLDKEFMKALERNDNTKKNEIASLKQQLRDMPITEDLTKLSSLEDLKNYIPDYLKDK